MWYDCMNMYAGVNDGRVAPLFYRVSRQGCVLNNAEFYVFYVNLCTPV